MNDIIRLGIAILGAILLLAFLDYGVFKGVVPDYYYVLFALFGVALICLGYYFDEYLHRSNR
jgi:hypothetical protein